MAGITFLPSATRTAQDNSAGNALKSGQSPIQVLSLNLPRILGAQAHGLLGGPPAGAPVGVSGTGSAQSPESMVMSALMQSMMTPSTSTDPASSGPMGPSPDPSGLGTPDTANPDELRRRLLELLGQPSNTPSVTQTGVDPSVPAPTPTFTPGDNGGRQPLPPPEPMPDFTGIPMPSPTPPFAGRGGTLRRQ